MVRSFLLLRNLFLSLAIGVGAFVAPLVATQFSHLRHWSFHYLISLGIALSNAAVLTAVFHLKTQDGISHLNFITYATFTFLQTFGRKQVWSRERLTLQADPSTVKSWE